MNNSNKYNRILLISAFFLPFTIAMIGLILGGFAPFGSKDIFTAGGHESQLTYYYELYDRLSSGESLLYSNRFGFGYSFISVIAYYLSDPLNLIALLFPRGVILSVFSIIYAVKIGLCGLTFSLFLMFKKPQLQSQKEEMEERRSEELKKIADKAKAKKEAIRNKAKSRGKVEKKDIKLGGSEAPNTRFGIFVSLLDFPILAFSTAYALSGFMFSNGLNPAYLSVAALLPLVILGLEQLIQTKKWRLYVIAYTAMLICNLHLSIVASLFVFIYFFLYDFENIKYAVNAFLRMILFDFVSCILALPVILPAVLGGAFSENTSLIFPYPAVYTSIFDTFKKLFTKTLSTSSEMYGFGIDIYCGFFCVLLFFLFFMNRNIKKSLRIRFSVVTLVFFYGTVIDTLNHLLNGFHFSEYNNILYGFSFSFLVLLMGYICFLNSDHISTVRLHVSALLISALIVTTVFFAFSYDSVGPFLAAFESLFAAYFILLLYKNNSMTKVFFSTSFAVFILVEVIVTYCGSLSQLGSNASLYSSTLDARYYATEMQIHEKEPDAKIYVYNLNKTSNPVNFMISGYDYIICDDSVSSVGIFLDKESSVQGIDIYKNPYALHGFYTEQNPETFPYYEPNPFLSYNVLSEEYLGGKDLFTLGGDFHLSGSGFSYDMYGLPNEHTSEFQIAGSVDKTGEYYCHLFSDRYIGKLEADTEAVLEFSIPLRNANGTSSMFNSYLFETDNFISLFNNQQKYTSNNNLLLSENVIRYSLYSDEAGYYVLDHAVLPFGSSITVNNTSVSIHRFYQDQIIVPVSAGQNEITISVSSCGLPIGIVISCFGFLLIILSYIAESRKTSKLIFTPTISLTDRISSFVADNYVYLTVMLIATAVYIIGMALTRSAPLGPNMLLVGDSYIQDYFGYINLHDSIKANGPSLLSYNIGLTRSNLVNYLGYLTHPLDFISIYTTPRIFYLFCVVLLKYLYLVFSGPALIYYLTHKNTSSVMKKTDARLIGFGVAYSLCTYAIANFIYQGFYFLVYLPLIMLALEQLIYNKKPLLYILLLGIFMQNAYYAFMMCEFLFLYFFTLRFDSFRDFIRKGIRFGLSSIAAAGLQSIYLLNFFSSTQDSPYKAGDSILPNFTNIVSPLKVFSKTAILTVPKTVIWDSSYVNIYCGILLFILIPAYLFSKNETVSERIRKFILAAVLFVSFIYEPLNYVMHGFHYQSGVPNRTAIFFIFLLFTFMYDVFVSAEKMNRIVLSISIITMSGLLVFSWFFKNDLLVSSIVSSIFVLGYLISTICYLVKKNATNFTNVISVLLCIEIIICGINSFYHTIGARAKNIYETQASIEKLVEATPNMVTPFVETEFINNSIDNYSLLTSTESISAFCSDLSMSHMNLITKWNILSSSNNIMYSTGNPLADMMLRVRYHVVNIYDEGAASEYELIHTTDNYELYENKNALSLGVFFEDNTAVTDWDSQLISTYENPFLYQNAFANALGFNDLYIPITLEDDHEKITDQSSFCYVDTSSMEDLTTADSVTIPITVFTAKDIEGSIFVAGANTMFYIGEARAGEVDEFMLSLPVSSDNANFTVSLAILNQEVLTQLSSKLSSYTMSNIVRTNDGLSGEITVPTNGKVFISLPNFAEWEVYVDNVPVEKTLFLGGIGIPVDSGTHQIKLKYKAPFAVQGILIFVCTLIGLIIYGVICRRRMINSKKKIEK